MSDLIRSRGDVQEVVRSRSSTFEKLIWQGENDADSFQIAVESPIPEDVRNRLYDKQKKFCIARYEIEIGNDASSNEIGINHETLWLRADSKPTSIRQHELFPAVIGPASSVLSKSSKGTKVALKKVPSGNDNYYPEGAVSYTPSFKLGRTRSALANMPADAKSFPVSSWFRALLETGVQSIILNSQIIRQPSPPGLGYRFQADGSNLPWVIEELRRDKKKFSNWIDHVKTALDDIADIYTVEREEDRHRYLVIRYSNGAEVPSWLVSDGTLRLLALTITAYLDNLSGVFLIEEPENGIHPRAIEPVIQSLSSIYEGQVIIATHSPVALNMLDPQQILCFAKDASGATDIVSGALHPALKNWKAGEPDLGSLFAAGILS